MHGGALLVPFGVLCVVGGLLVLAGRLTTPYPILLVVGGIALGLVPGMPDVEVDPDVILLVALPPLLYQAAFFSSLREMRDTARPILSLAIGLVVATSAGVAVVAHHVAGLPWAPAFVLGAVLSPTDPVAASAIASRLGAPRRFVTVVATVLVVRFAWTFVVGALPRLLRARLGRADGPPWVEVLLVGFTGMRGAVSVAAALAIPLETRAGAPLPGRDLIIFLTYVVVVVTVVGQGLALPRLLRRIAPEGRGDQLEREEDEARVAAARAALERLEEVGDVEGVQDRTLRRLRELYRFRLERFEARLEGDGREDLEEGSVAYQRLRMDLLERERRAIIDLRDAGAITDDALHRVEHDLDLDEARLEVSEGVGPHAASPLQLGDAE